ncbi:MAG: nucleoside hydrolase, partial [Acetivibrio sp.]
PVAKGAEKPLKRNLIIADYIHGKTGLDGADLPLPTVEDKKQRALDLMVQMLSTSEEKITIVATGPLTNIAILLLSHPELKEKVESIVFMGGACFGGNYTPNSEFNIYVDPEAAEVVTNCGLPVYMFGLDVTLKAQFFKEDVEEVKNFNTQTSEVMGGLLEFFSNKIAQPFLAPEDHIEGMHLHDACAMAYLVDPDMFTMVHLNVAVNTQEGLGLGQTVVDYNNKTKKEKNVWVGFDIDLNKFRNLVKESILKFN